MLKTIAAATVLLLSSMTSAHALSDAPTNFTSFYTTDGDGSTTMKSDFSWNSKPWLYARLEPNANDVQQSTVYNVEAWFQNDNSSQPFVKFSVVTSQNTWWSALSDHDWDVLKQPGTWYITASALSFNPTLPLENKQYSSTASFHVNAAPEPISTTLFLTGGLLLGAGVINRRKKLTV